MAAGTGMKNVNASVSRIHENCIFLNAGSITLLAKLEIARIKWGFSSCDILEDPFQD